MSRTGGERSEVREHLYIVLPAYVPGRRGHNLTLILMKMTKKAKSNNRVVKSIFDYELTPDLMEQNSKEQKTVPNQVLSLHDILLNHTQGILTNQYRHGIDMYTEDFEDHDMEKLGSEDLLDLEEQKAKMAHVSDAISKQKPSAVKAEEKHEESKDSKEEATDSTQEKEATNLE